MNSHELRIIGLTGMKEVVPGDRIGALIAESAASCCALEPGDVLVVAQKIVSKAEGRLVRLSDVEPSARAVEWAETAKRDPRLIEVVLREAKRIVRMERDILIVETRHGFVCANAGVDTSNVEPDAVTLLPVDPDQSARDIRAEIRDAARVDTAVIVSDTFGRPWREGLVNVALGVAGLDPLLDYRGQKDGSGRTLQATVIAVADELASAAELVMGKSSRIPVVVVRGVERRDTGGSGQLLVRSPEKDLFR